LNVADCYISDSAFWPEVSLKKNKDPVHLQKDELQNEQIEEEDVLKQENAEMDTKGGGRHDYSRSSREQNTYIAQLDNKTDGSNDGEDIVRGVMLNEPETRFPFVIKEDRLQRVHNEFLLNILSSEPIQSGFAQLAQSGYKINHGHYRIAGVNAKAD